MKYDTREPPPSISQQLPNKKHELFCRFVAEGETYTNAYELAGYTPSTSNASGLAAKPDIKARIAVLKEEAEHRELEFRVRMAEAGLDPNNPKEAKREVIIWTAEKVREALADNARLAQIAGEFKAARESLELIGKSLRMFEHDTTGKLPNGNPAGEKVSLTFVNQVLAEADGEGGDGAADGRNPLAPRVSRTRKSKPVK